jgi:hypothetical protein
MSLREGIADFSVRIRAFTCSGIFGTAKEKLEVKTAAHVAAKAACDIACAEAEASKAKSEAAIAEAKAAADELKAVNALQPTV